jgi:hypothetical protein
MNSFRALAGLLVLSLILWAGAGCYEPKYPIGSADNSMVDPAYVGNFAVPDEEATASSSQPTVTTATQTDKKGMLVIRLIDRHRYYVECDDEKGNASDPMRMVGFITEVNGVAIASLELMDPEGKPPEGFFLMRVSLSADHNTLSYRDFDDKFFADKKIDSADAELKLIAANLDNDQMYDGPMVTATRVPIPK